MVNVEHIFLNLYRNNLLNFQQKSNKSNMKSVGQTWFINSENITNNNWKLEVLVNKWLHFCIDNTVYFRS